MGTKKCPFCAEEILVDARKCKFCGEYLDEDLRKSQKSTPEQKVVVEQKRDGLGTFLVVLAIIALLLLIVGV